MLEQEGDLEVRFSLQNEHGARTDLVAMTWGGIEIAGAGDPVRALEITLRKRADS